LTNDHLIEQVRKHLASLCSEIDNRRVGSPGNQAAASYFSEICRSNGFEIERIPFDCIDWQSGTVQLEAAGQPYEACASPYSLGCQASGTLVAAGSFEELKTVPTDGTILLLHGAIAAEQLMPKRFPFYNPEHHQQIIKRLEDRAPLAIITATGRNPELAGGMYPFPLIEDGDFHIPSVYIKDREGERLLNHVGDMVILESSAERIPSTGSNVIARKFPTATQKVIVCAHIDAKINTPGALDNAGGTVVLLLLLELLKEYESDLGIEIIAFNGEDYFSAPGQVQYIQLHGHRFNEILIAVNLDGVGYFEGMDAYSLYGCTEQFASTVHNVFSRYETLTEGKPWYQSDHSIFIQNQVPAMALTTDHFNSLWTEITHTERDTPDLIDPGKLVANAYALRDLIEKLAIKDQSPQ
jgi:aminopeptidase YwaD